MLSTHPFFPFLLSALSGPRVGSGEELAGPIGQTLP